MRRCQGPPRGTGGWHGHRCGGECLKEPGVAAACKAAGAEASALKGGSALGGGSVRIFAKFTLEGLSRPGGFFSF